MAAHKLLAESRQRRRRRRALDVGKDFALLELHVLAQATLSVGPFAQTWVEHSGGGPASGLVVQSAR